MEHNPEKTYHLGLIGWPLKGSSSPKLHQAALDAAGLRGEYRLFPISPASEGENPFQEILAGLRSGQLDGLNVTIPHKQTVMPWVDRLTPIARAVGAVNTLTMRDGYLVGDNTDAPGFRADLHTITGWDIDRPASNPVGGEALVLGAGGAARAVVFVFAQLGWRISLAARRLEQAEELAETFRREAGPEICAMTLGGAEFSALNERPLLVVNATPVGMDPDVTPSPWPDDTPFPPAGFVYDLITHPRETTLMRQAKSAGLGTCNGLGMLVEQAAVAFEAWTGRSAPRAAMRAAVNLRPASSG